MAKADIMNILYSKDKSPLEFKFDSLTAPPLLSFITPLDVQRLYNIASSVKYASKIELKYKEIDKVMKNRDFIKFHSGTNRVVYRPRQNKYLVTKIAVDEVGLGDNPSEYQNQFLLKPFVTKVFEHSPCGTIGLFERVQPITSREEFMHVAPDIFELLNNYIIGEYVLEDIGTKYFMNFGIRVGFGVVLLDFPYVYKLDGNKLHCNNKLVMQGNRICGGLIDYDDGFNNLICTGCGKRYLAKELRDNNKHNKFIIMKEGDNMRMRVQLCRGGKVIKQTEISSDTIQQQKTKKMKKSSDKRVGGGLGVRLVGRDPKPTIADIINSKKQSEENNTEKISNNFINTKEEYKQEVKKEVNEYQKEIPTQDIILNDNNINISEQRKELKEENDTFVKAREVINNLYETSYNSDKQNINDEQIPGVQSKEDASDILSKYNLSENDFEEDQTNIEDIEQKYSHLEEQYSDNNFQKIRKSPKHYY